MPDNGTPTPKTDCTNDDFIGFSKVSAKRSNRMDAAPVPGTTPSLTATFRRLAGCISDSELMAENSAIVFEHRDPKPISVATAIAPSPGTKE